MPYELNTKRRGKGFAGFFTVGALSLMAITGTAYAALSTSTNTEADSEALHSELTNNFRFNYFHSEDNELIDVDITPQEQIGNLTFVKKITNDSSLPAQAILTVDDFDTANIPATLLDRTTVKVNRSDFTSPSYVATVTLREFVDYGIYIDKVIPSDKSFDYNITFVTPSASAYDYTDSFGDFEETFSTSVTFSQAIGGVSPLDTYSKNSANNIRKLSIPGESGFLVKKDGISDAITEAPVAE